MVIEWSVSLHYDVLSEQTKPCYHCPELWALGHLISHRPAGAEGKLSIFIPAIWDIYENAKTCCDLWLYHVGGLMSWWHHQMVTFSMLLALCERNSLVTRELPSQGPMTQSFDVFFDLRLNKWLGKQSVDWWFGMPSCSLWRQCNGECVPSWVC